MIVSKISVELIRRFYVKVVEVRLSLLLYIIEIKLGRNLLPTLKKMPGDASTFFCFSFSLQISKFFNIRMYRLDQRLILIASLKRKDNM